MKKVLLVLILLATSCGVEPPCECQEQTYSYSYNPIEGTQTMINVEFKNIGCVDEVDEIKLPNTSGSPDLERFGRIVCN